MQVSNIIFDVVEVLIMMYFMIGYFDLYQYKKNIVLFFMLLLAGVLVCDVFLLNGGTLATIYFLFLLGYFYSCKRKVSLFDVFIIGIYVGFVFIIPTILSLFLSMFIPKDMYAYSFSFLLTAALSKVILLLFTLLLIKFNKYQFIIKNRFYWLIIISEIGILLLHTVMGNFLVIEYFNFSLYIFIYLSLIIIFVLIIIYGIHLNKLYQEKTEYEKNRQKEFYVKQSLQLIENMKFDIDNTEHRMYWIMEKIKILINQNKIDEINDVIKEFDNSFKNKQKAICSGNPYFDTVLSWKINELLIKHIDIKPLLQLTKSSRYEDIDFINTIIQILSYIKDDSKVTLNIKDQNIYVIVELYAKNDFYLKDKLNIKEIPLIIGNQYHDEEDLHVVKFILGENDE